MRPESPGPADATADARDDPAEGEHGARASIARLLERILAWGPVPRIRFILDAYGDAGGGILAGGLAFGALFALIPATLLVVGVAGFFVGDPEIRAQLLRQIAERVPPLEEFFTLALVQLASGAVAISLVGLAGFAWTAAQFYGQLDHAFALIFRSPVRREFLERTVRGLIAVALVVALFVVLLVTGFTLGAAPTGPADVATGIVRLGSRVLGLGVTVAVVAFVYRIVPTERVTWRAVGVPALVIGLAQGILTAIYAIVAPVLASPQVFGPFFTVFAALVWLSWTFQILLIGAAWVRTRAFGIGESTEGPGG